MTANWDFIGANTKEFTHCFHSYPAMMIPQVARGLISTYGKPGQILFDPFCGSGTSLVEARFGGMNATGFDLNHLARKISEAKTRNYNKIRLNAFVNRITKQLKSLKLLRVDTAINSSGFDGERLRSWYPDQSIREIASVISMINDVAENEQEYWFARIALSECLRQVSLQRNREVKLYRIAKQERKEYFIPLLPLFQEKLERNLSGVVKYREELGARGFLRTTSVRVSNTNAASTHVFDLISNDPFDLVVTSPPYGDSETTVAYAQFSWLTNVWLGLDTRVPGHLDREMMGGSVEAEIEEMGCDKIDRAIGRIESIDEYRAREVHSFYRDYLSSIKHVSLNVKPSGHVCYVVGNRTVKGEFLRTDIFTQWAFENAGFKHVDTITRRLTGTKMPGLISPTGKKGEVTPTMDKEYIVICKKN